MPVPVADPNYAAEGQGLITSRYNRLKVVPGIVKSLMTRLQEIENSFNSLLNAMQLANHPMAGGPWVILDLLGTLVGIPFGGRNGLDDADFLAYIKLRARVNRARGLSEDVLGLASLMAAGNPFLYLETPPAAFYLGVWNVALNYPTFAPLIAQARSAGVYGLFCYSTWSDGNDFEWCYGAADGSGQGGWGSHYDATAGGYLVASTVL